MLTDAEMKKIEREVEKRLGNYECENQMSIFDYIDHPEYLDVEPSDEIEKE